MKRALRYTRTAFAAYLALYFLCNAALLHNHIIDGQNISHSHIFKGISHTADEASLISLFNITPAENVETAFELESAFVWEREIFIPFCRIILDKTSCRDYLRGPPAILF